MLSTITIATAVTIMSAITDLKCYIETFRKGEDYKYFSLEDNYILVMKKNDTLIDKDEEDETHPTKLYYSKNLILLHIIEKFSFIHVVNHIYRVNMVYNMYYYNSIEPAFYSGLSKACCYQYVIKTFKNINKLITYHDNGQIEKEMNYLNGSLFSFRSWYKSGMLDETGYMKNGFKTGVFRKMFETGSLHTMSIINGKNIKTMLFYENGKKYKMLNSIDDKITEFEEWHMNGIPKTILTKCTTNPHLKKYICRHSSGEMYTEKETRDKIKYF